MHGDCSTQRPGLFAALGRLVREVVFVGRDNPVAERPRFLSLLFVALVPGLLLYPCLDFHLLEPDESRYAQIPREMLARGDWVVPTLQGEPYLDKPPLMYWSVMLAFSVFGPDDWAARLVPALAVHLTILATYLFGLRSLGERAAFWAAVCLSAVPGLVTVGRVLILDGLLTLWVTLGVGCTLEALRGQQLRRGWWLLASLAVALGALTKGPIALILVTGPVLAWRVLRPDAPRPSWRDLGLTAGVVLGVNLPWYVAIAFREPVFLRYFLWDHNVVRFVQPFDHIKPVWFYGPVLALCLLPFTGWLVGLVRMLVSGDPRRAAARTPEFGYHLAAAGWCVLFFSMSGCKLPTYILPAFPPLALALGRYFADGRPGAGCRWPAATAVAGLAVLFAVHHVALPWYAQVRSPYGRPELLAGYLDDPQTPAVCYPRNCDSVAFYLGRDDLRNVRSKHTYALVVDLLSRPRTVVLFTHRHSLEALKNALPPELRVSRSTSLHRTTGWKLLDLLAGETPWGLCDIAVVERTAG